MTQLQRGTDRLVDRSTPRQLVAQGLNVVMVAAVWLALLLLLTTCQSPPPPIETPSDDEVTWDDVIGPLFAEHCLLCHGGSSGLSLDTYEKALRGGKRGPAIVSGDGQGSLVVQALRGSAGGLTRMPLNRPPLADELIDTLSMWIDAGAPQRAP